MLKAETEGSYDIILWPDDLSEDILSDEDYFLTCVKVVKLVGWREDQDAGVDWVDNEESPWILSSVQEDVHNDSIQSTSRESR